LRRAFCGLGVEAAFATVKYDVAALHNLRAKLRGKIMGLREIVNDILPE
jgi:hypothetical protein